MVAFTSSKPTLGHKVQSGRLRPFLASNPRSTAPVVVPVCSTSGLGSSSTPSWKQAPKRSKNGIAHFKNPEADAVSLVKEAENIVPVSKRPPAVSWAGAGIYFFWQLGAMKFLAERYDLTKVPMVGASGGALAAVLAGCGVDADLVLQRAYELSFEYNIWERRLGLVGVWGSLIETWLDQLLPDNAAELCRDRITIVVTTLPKMHQKGYSDFTDKKDLINLAMASSHIPMFLDMKFARYCRGRYCIDGSFPDFFYNDNSDLLKNEGQAVIFDYFQDPNLVRTGRMDMLNLKSYEEVKKNMDFGYMYAKKLHSEGQLHMFGAGELVAVEQLEQVAKK